MKRLIAAIALGLTSVAAPAAAGAPRYAVDDGSQTSIYAPVGSGPPGDLRAAARLCADRVGAAAPGSETRAYKACMRAGGWKYRYTTRDGEYPDPRHPGSVCHDIVVFGVVGSSCSNF